MSKKVIVVLDVRLNEEDRVKLRNSIVKELNEGLAVVDSRVSHIVVIDDAVEGGEM